MRMRIDAPRHDEGPARIDNLGPSWSVEVFPYGNHLFAIDEYIRSNAVFGGDNRSASDSAAFSSTTFVIDSSSLSLFLIVGFSQFEAVSNSFPLRL